MTVPNITVDEVIELPAAPEVVWARLTDLASWGDWLTVHRTWLSDLPETLAVGTRLKSTVAVMNLPLTIDWTITEYDAPRRVVVDGQGLAGIRARLAIDVVPVDEGSSFALGLSLESQLLAGTMGEMFEKTARTELDTSVAKLAGLLA